MNYILCIRSTLKREDVLDKRKAEHAFVNPFNKQLLFLWEANIDIQFCLHMYAVARGHCQTICAKETNTRV